MSENHEHEQPQAIRIPLDGTYGAGPNATLTIITKTPNGNLKEESFEFPFLLIDTKKHQFMVDFNLIVGFKLLKHDDHSVKHLRELGL